MTDLLDSIGPVRGVLHAGAHHGQEGPVYASRTAGPVCWVEPHPEAFAVLARHAAPGAVLFNCALGAASGRAALHVATNEGQSSSLLRPKEHLRVHPEVAFSGTVEVTVERMANLPLDFTRFNLLVMDVQGAELEVLQGGETVLGAFEYIIAEIQNTELYEHGVLLDDLTAWLQQRGFRRERVIWRTATWGDALFVKGAPARTPAIHAFIFSWRDLAPKAQELARLIGPHADKLSVISSGQAGAGPDWTVLHENAYFGEQWNAALRDFEGDILFHHQADARLLGTDYGRLMQCARESLRAENWGVYAPRVDHSGWNGSHLDLPGRGDGLFEVANTDCTCWMVHREILSMQPRALENMYGWGLDQLYCNQSRHLNRPVLRDYRFLVHHPRSTGYDPQRANDEWARFGRKFRVASRGPGPGWS